MILNPAAHDHTGVALRDAIGGVGLPRIEIHLSNIHAREPFRRHSPTAEVAVGLISGFSAHSDLLGVQAALAHLKPRAAGRSVGPGGPRQRSRRS